MMHQKFFLFGRPGSRGAGTRPGSRAGKYRTKTKKTIGWPSRPGLRNFRFTGPFTRLVGPAAGVREVRLGSQTGQDWTGGHPIIR